MYTINFHYFLLHVCGNRTMVLMDGPAILCMVTCVMQMQNFEFEWGYDPERQTMEEYYARWRWR
jgi:hypothetical protein